MEKDMAYHCFCSEEELKAHKEYLLSIGEAPRYSGKCAKLSPKEIEQNLAQKKPFVIRFKTPAQKVKFNDLIRGPIEFDGSLIGDIVIAKDFSTPLYNFACVVDDFEMKISHVIRGEDHISNTPKQILLQKALDLPHPEYAHLPLVLGPDKSKLSKRHGATSVSEYREEGYLPETLINFMAFLGWNPDTEREIYSLNSLVKEFSLEKVQKSGAIFNTKRLSFLNKFYIRQKSINKLTELCIPYLIKEGFIEPEFKESQYPPAYGGKEIFPKYKVSAIKKELTIENLQKMVELYQERLEKVSQITQLIDFFFKQKLQYDKSLLGWNEMTDKEILSSLKTTEKLLLKIEKENFSKSNLSEILMSEAEKFAKTLKKTGDRGYLLWPLRVALTGKEASAGPFEIAEILGKEKVIERIKEAKLLLDQ
jgi:glutamyl-tRNA synthetase